MFSVWPVAQPVVGEMEMHSVANLATLQTPLVTFFPFKIAPKPYLVSENPSTHTPLSLSLSLCASTRFSVHPSLSLSLSLSVRLLSFCSARGREEQHFNIMLLASLILHASIAEITAQPLLLSYVDLISYIDGSIIRIFVQINILEERAGL